MFVISPFSLSLFFSFLSLLIFLFSLSPYILFMGGITIVNYERKTGLGTLFLYFYLIILFTFSIYRIYNNEGMSFVFVRGNMLSGCLGRTLRIPLPLAFYTFTRRLWQLKKSILRMYLKGWILCDHCLCDYLQVPRQRFKDRWFIWEVTLGDPDRGTGKWDREGKRAHKVHVFMSTNWISVPTRMKLGTSMAPVSQSHLIRDH